MQFGHTVLKRNFDKNQYFIFILKFINKKQLAKANCSENYIHEFKEYNYIMVKYSMNKKCKLIL